MNMSRLTLGAFGLFLAVLFFVNNMGYPTRAAQIPLIFATAVGFLSLALIAREVFVSRRESVLSSVGSANGEFKSQRNGKGVLKALTIYVAALLYAYIIGVVGYFIATALFLGISLFIVRGVNAKYAVLGTACLLAVIGLVFFRLLGLNMPTLPAF